MRFFLNASIRQYLVILNILAILMMSPGGPLLPQTASPQAQQAEPQPAKLPPATLDNTVARIALYPDPLLAQIMAASTFAEQIPAATQWAVQHKGMTGDALANAMDAAKLPFDPSIQALIAFPSILEMMNKDQAWTEQLGDATLVQRGDVMDAVQRMRKRAYDAGNLKTSPQATVVQSAPQVIEIQPASPTVIYVPTYNPQTVYVPAPPPPPGPSTGAVVAAAAIGFTLGVALSHSYCNSYWGYHGGFGWSSHTVVIHNSAWGRTWVNHGSYVHTWGGVNRGFYARPNAYVNTNAYVRHNANVNVNRNVNVNVNRNVNVNQNANINRNMNVNQNVNRNAYANQARGYSAAPRTASASTFSGVQNGRREQAAASRGRMSRGRR